MSVLLVAAGCALVVGLWLTAQAIAHRRMKRALGSAKARWELQHQQDSSSTVMECFTMGWCVMRVRP